MSRPEAPTRSGSTVNICSFLAQATSGLADDVRTDTSVPELQGSLLSEREWSAAKAQVHRSTISALIFGAHCQ